MISVIMSTYKEPVEYIHYSVQSILNQTYKNFEFIIVADDPENAPIIAALEEYAAQDSRVKLHINTKNLGPAGARNAALSRATGEYIAVLDADDQALPDRLKKQLQFIQHTGADLVGCRLQCFSDTAVLGESSVFSEVHLRKHLCVGNPLGHSGWLVKKSVYNTLAGYRDIPKAEDYDFLLRALMSGFHMLQQDEVLVRYRANPLGDSQTALLQQFLTARYLAKNRHHLEDVTKARIEKEVLSKITAADRQNFAAATKTITAIAPLKKTKPVNWLLQYTKNLFSSKYYFGILMRSLRIKLIRLLYK